MSLRRRAFAHSNNSTQHFQTETMVRRLLRRKRRDQKQGSEPPLFADDHSISGESEAGTSDEETNIADASPKFTTRVIVSSGSNNGASAEPAEDTDLETTLGLENCSDCSSEAGNELTIISSAVIEQEQTEGDDDEDDEDGEDKFEEVDVEAPPESPLEEAKPEIKVSQEETDGRNKFVFLCVFCVVVVLVGVVTTASVVPIHKKNRLEDLGNDGIDLTEITSLYPTEVPSAVNASFDDDLLFAFNSTNSSTEDLAAPDDMAEMTTTIGPTNAPTNEPSASPTFDPSVSPSNSPSLFEPFNFSSVFIDDFGLNMTSSIYRLPDDDLDVPDDAATFGTSTPANQTA